MILSCSRFSRRGLFLATCLGWTTAITNLGGCRQNDYVPPPPPEVICTRATEEDTTPQVVYTGTTEPYETVEVVARVRGFLKEIHFQAGATVEKDTPLYEIDAAPFLAQVEAAKAKVKQCEAQLVEAQARLEQSRTAHANAEAQYQRVVPLARSGAVSEEELDEKRTFRDVTKANITAAEAGIGVAQTAIDAAKAELTVAELDLGYTKILAPLAGRVGRTRVDRGNLVGNTGATVLTSMMRYDPIYATFSISSTDLLRFLERRRSDNDFSNVQIALAMDGEEGFPHQGEFDFADLAVDPNTGTYLARAVFDNKQERIVPGLFVRIRLRSGRTVRSLAIDERAIVADRRGDYVLVVNDDDKVERRDVQLGDRLPGKRVIEQGLTEKDWVIVSGLQRATEGSTVNPRRIEPAPASSPGDGDQV